MVNNQILSYKYIKEKYKYIEKYYKIIQKYILTKVF